MPLRQVPRNHSSGGMFRGYWVAPGGLLSLAREVDSLPVGLILVLFGGFCALWAQNTGRSAWAWFFLGLLFNVFTLIALLSKNAREARLEDAGGG